jgi:heat shock protein HtpX
VDNANLFEQQRLNRRRSKIVVATFLAFFAWVGFGGDLAFYLMTADVKPGEYRHAVPWIGIVATLLGVGLAWHAWHAGAKRVLWATGAKKLESASTPQERMLINVVEEMAIASGLPLPSIWMIDETDPNAFATGTKEAASHVAVTSGLLDTLSRDELQGVVAHEMAHIRNHDVKLMTLLAALTGVILLMSDAAWRSMRFGGSRGKGGGRGKKGHLGLLILVAWLITLLIAPILSRLLALAVSRKRELLADATGAQFTRNPAALASALRKIEDANAPTKSIGRGSAHLCIADPLGRRLTHKEGFVADLLATHPPMGLRVAQLKAMAFQYETTGILPETV